MILSILRLLRSLMDHKSDVRAAVRGSCVLEKALLLCIRVTPLLSRAIHAPPLLLDRLTHDAATLHLVHPDSGFDHPDELGSTKQARVASIVEGFCRFSQISASIMAFSRILEGSSLVNSKQKAFLAFHMCHKTHGKTNPASGCRDAFLLHLTR